MKTIPPNAQKGSIPSTNIDHSVSNDKEEATVPQVPKSVSTRENRTICLPWDPKTYDADVSSPEKFRERIDALLRVNPELFPVDMLDGYRMKDIYFSVKIPGFAIRRIVTNGVSYTIRPSFVMPYCAEYVMNVENALFLRKFNVPFWALGEIFGRDAMFWYRREVSLGKLSLVETTVNKPELLPDHLVADEKHTRLGGDKVYVPTTVANECILGCEVVEDAGNDALLNAYGVFKEEAQKVKNDYAPKTVNLDGWKAGRNAWTLLFPGICVISCFLHVYIKLRDSSPKKLKDTFDKIATLLWECYSASSKASFSQRVRRLYEWSESNSVPEFIRKRIKRFRDERQEFSVAYEYPNAHRTSNMLDRLMQRMDRCLFDMQYFHGKIDSAKLMIRGWCCIQNFAPSNPLTQKKHAGLKSPAERFNGFSYHNNWLQNLLVSTSLATRYRSKSATPLKVL